MTSKTELPLKNGAKLPDEDHILRHVPTKRLIKDDSGNILGMFPEAMTPRPIDNNCLSVNWIEYFKSTHQVNLEKTVESIRNLRDIKQTSTSAYALYNVKALKDITAAKNSPVRIVYNGNDPNFSHAQIKDVSPEEATLLQLLCDSSINILPNQSFK